jgi:hypothetical protein
MDFKHLVGKSTLQEGITIYKNFESFFNPPAIGNKRDITLLFDGDNSIKVTLRRLNNVRQHVHIKYSTKSHTPLINWLNGVFQATKKGTVGEFLQFNEVSTDVYRLVPITIDDSNDARLYIADAMHHKTSDMDSNNFYPNEVDTIIKSIKFEKDESQSFYNKKFEQAFIQHGWTKEGKALPELDLKYDFRKNGVQIEVEFGNARSYYQDYIKFMLSYQTKQINMGILIAPTFSFANILCEIGRQKALLRGKKSYSGMIHYEKVYKEFRYLKNIFNIPIAILGIDINCF